MQTVGLLPSQELMSLRQNEHGIYLNVPDGKTVVPLVKLPEPPHDKINKRAVPKLVWYADKVERDWDIVDLPVPVMVSFRALAFALKGRNLYNITKQAALSSDDGEIWWETVKSSTVRRDHPFVAQLALGIGQTDTQIDTIFREARAIDV